MLYNTTTMEDDTDAALKLAGSVGTRSHARFAVPNFRLDPGRLDQHLLVSNEAVERLCDFAEVDASDSVIDVGSGTGVIAEALAHRARTVLAIELDERFSPLLAELQTSHPNLEVAMADFRAVKLEGYNKIVANPPFGLLEILLKRAVVTRQVRLLALVLGRASAEVLSSAAGSSSFTRLTLLAQAFYDLGVPATLAPDDFHPAPRTGAAIVLFKRRVGISPQELLLQEIALQVVFKAGHRVRDVAAALHAKQRLPMRLTPALLRERAVWSKRLQSLTNEQISAMTADLLRAVGQCA